MIIGLLLTILKSPSWMLNTPTMSSRVVIVRMGQNIFTAMHDGLIVRKFVLVQKMVFAMDNFRASEISVLVIVE